MDRFGSLGAVLAAPARQRDEVVARLPAVRRQLALLRRAELHLRRRRAFDDPGLGDWRALLDYVHASQAFATVEVIRVLFLTTRNTLIRDEVMATGTVDQAPVYVREIIRRALELGAAAIILIHNHPSGSHRPSRADVEITRCLAQVGRSLGVTLHDHLVVAPGGHSSLRSMGLT